MKTAILNLMKTEITVYEYMKNKINKIHLTELHRTVKNRVKHMIQLLRGW
jgi:hypothetical protein